MTLMLVRHGETALNAARVMQPADTPLSPRGQAQAMALASRMIGLGVAAIWSSDLPRALQTAQALVNRGGAALSTSPLLHERNFGDLRGRPYDTLGFDPLLMQEAPSGGESMAQFAERVATAFNEALRLQATLNGPLVVVSHGLVIAEMLRTHLRLSPGMKLPERMRNTSLTVASSEAPYRVSLLDCTRHLDASGGDDAASLSGG